MRTVFEKNLGTLSAYDLIQKLDEDYPHRCVSKDQTLDDANRYAGKRELVDSLLARIRNEER